MVWIHGGVAFVKLPKLCVMMGLWWLGFWFKGRSGGLGLVW